MSKMSDLKIVFEQESGAAGRLVVDRLDLYNIAQTAVPSFYPVNFFVRNARGETLGGLLGSVWGGWMHIRILWVDESVRGQDWGTKLMDQAEDYARERGCHSIELDTHSFQARPFYESRGFEVFGTLDDYPKGHRKFYMRKKLSSA
jgi:ribosomal protein S18 acetylase RimI-like enzyme